MTTMKKNRGRYVEIPAHRIEEEARDIGRRVEARGGRARWTTEGRERVFELDTHKANGTRVRFFTTLPVDGDTVRDCGADAARIVVVSYADGTTKPLEKATRILRTAPRKLASAHRIEAWIARVRQALRDAYGRALRVRECPKCGRAMAHRNGRNGPFLGCTGYPVCKTTAAAA